MFAKIALPISLFAAPLVAAGVFSVLARISPGRHRNDGGGRIFFAFIALLFIVIGLLLWAIGVYQASLLPDLLSRYPKEFWRWAPPVWNTAIMAGVSGGVGARLFHYWRPSTQEPSADGASTCS